MEVTIKSFPFRYDSSEGDANYMELIKEIVFAVSESELREIMDRLNDPYFSYNFYSDRLIVWPSGAPEWPLFLVFFKSNV